MSDTTNTQTETKVETPATESKIKAKTLKEFDGVTVGTLRAWERYWMNENRHKSDPAITEERPVAKHLELIRAELKARGK